MKKYLCKSPLISLVIFGIFIMLFVFICRNFYVSKYIEVDFKISDIDISESIIRGKIETNIELYRGQNCQLVYSDNEQVLRGEVINIEAKDVTLLFYKLSSISIDKIKESKIKINKGKEPIWSDLWYEK